MRQITLFSEVVFCFWKWGVNYILPETNTSPFSCLILQDLSGQRKSPPTEPPDNGSQQINQSGPNQTVASRPPQSGQTGATTGKVECICLYS